MDTFDIARLEDACLKLYVSTDQNERTKVTNELVSYAGDLNRLKFLLDGSKSPYAQHFAVSSMIKLMTSHWNSCSPTMRIEIKNHLLNYLASNTNLTGFVITTIIQAICKITKLSWFDESATEEKKFPHQDIVDVVSSFFQHSSSSQFYFFVGLRILNQLVTEMGESTTVVVLSINRKIVNSFREKCLLSIFKLSLTSLTELFNPSSQQQNDQLKKEALDLSFRCLSFDFLGTAPDESTDAVERHEIQMPASWKSLFEGNNTQIPSLFYSIYTVSKPPLSELAMKCLVQLCAIRITFWDGSKELNNWLQFWLGMSKDVIQNQKGIKEAANFHEFCRLLARVQNTYHISKLVNIDAYLDWITSVARFTVDSLGNIQLSIQSSFHLLVMWARMAATFHYQKPEVAVASRIDTYAPQVAEAFISSRMEAVKSAVQTADSEDDIEQFATDHVQIVEQMESFHSLCRCQYSRTSSFIISLFDQLFLLYRSTIETQASDNNFVILQGQLAMLVYIIGFIIHGRLVSRAEEYDPIDAELAARAFELLKVHEQHLTRTPDSACKSMLELALLDFLQQFRKIHIDDQSTTPSKLYGRLVELRFFPEGSTEYEMFILTLLLSKLASNLKHWASNELVIEKSLSLLHDMSLGYRSSKFVARLDITNQFLLHHTSQYFPFLDIESNVRKRRNYYTSLTRILLIDEKNLHSKFEAFVEPFSKPLGILMDPNVSYRSEECRVILINLMRDLRGIIEACTSRRSYQLFFEWFYPQYFFIMVKTIATWSDTYAVVYPVLRFVSEFVFNVHSRIEFDSHSPNGILLFKDMSKLLVTYGNSLFNSVTINSNNIYTERYRGIYLCQLILTRGLAGGYCNFGVFSVYQDPALTDAIDICFKLSLSIPIPEILVYPKLIKTFFALLEIIANHHTAMFAKLDSNSFHSVIVSLKEGLEAFELVITSRCCNAIDQIISYHLGKPTKNRDVNAANIIASHIASSMDVFADILKTLFKKVLFEDCQNQWTVSRPMLSLILLNPNAFNAVKSELISLQQTQQAQQQLIKDFEDLMSEIQMNLEPLNRDKFTTHLNTFVMEVKKYIML